jgi:hypothetical protein
MILLQKVLPTAALLRWKQRGWSTAKYMPHVSKVYCRRCEWLQNWRQLAYSAGETERVTVS